MGKSAHKTRQCLLKTTKMSIMLDRPKSTDSKLCEGIFDRLSSPLCSSSFHTLAKWNYLFTQKYISLTRDDTNVHNSIDLYSK